MSIASFCWMCSEIGTKCPQTEADSSSSATIAWALFAALVGMVLGAALADPAEKKSPPPPPPKPCAFCKSDSDIYAYHAERKKERIVANYCPLCGRVFEDPDSED